MSAKGVPLIFPYDDFSHIIRENKLLKEDLRQIQHGESIVIPWDVEHARSMFKMACHYLSNHDPEFDLKLV
jgi:hypothetical protein